MKHRYDFRLICQIAILFLLLTGCDKPTKPVSLTIAVGPIMKPALLEIKEIYAQQKPNVTINFNFGSSGDNSQAIERGANIDIFISAASSFMDTLQSKGFLVADTRKAFLSSKMVLIVPKNAIGISSFKDLTSSQVKQIALPDVQITAAGKYALEILTYFGILEQVKPKFVLHKSSVDVVDWLEMGKADAGIVIATEALGSNQIKIVAIAPENSHSPVTFFIAVLQGSKNIPQGKEFVAFLLSEQASSVFVKYGFTIPVSHNTAQ